MITTTTPSSPCSSWTVRRRTSTLLHAATSSLAPTSGRSSSCCRRLLCPPAGARPSPKSHSPPPTTWRRCPTCWTTTATLLRPSSSPSSSRTACGAAASPPPPSWRRWCLRGWSCSGPDRTPAPPLMLTPPQREQLTSRGPGLMWTRGTCRTSTPQPRTASTPRWCFLTQRWARRAVTEQRWRWHQSVWTLLHSAAVTVNQVGAGFYFGGSLLSSCISSFLNIKVICGERFVISIYNLLVY